MVTFTQTLGAINWYQKGDSLYIWAESGLNLRADKNIKSNILETIPYGAIVVTLEEKRFGEKNDPNFSIELFNRNQSTKKDRFKLEGKWVKVKFGNKEGFVFDAYLSKLPTLVEIDLENSSNKNTKYYESFSHYLERIDKDVDYEETTVKEWEDFTISKWISKKGIILKLTSIWGREDYEIILSDFSKEEAYLILDRLFNIGDIMEQRLKLGGEEVSDSSNSLHLRLNEISHASLNNFGNTVIIKISSGD